MESNSKCSEVQLTLGAAALLVGVANTETRKGNFKR